MLGEFGDKLKQIIGRRPDALSAPSGKQEEDGIVFTFLDAAPAPAEGLALDALPDGWLRAHCRENAYVQAQAYLRSGKVSLGIVSADRVSAVTHGDRDYVQTLQIAGGVFAAQCSCDSFRTRGSAADLCRHCVAVLMLVAQQAASEREQGLVGSICPITRQNLSTARRIYRCRRCRLAYSIEGWEFLQEVSRGECCGCRCANTIFPAA